MWAGAPAFSTIGQLLLLLVLGAVLTGNVDGQDLPPPPRGTTVVLSAGTDYPVWSLPTGVWRLQDVRIIDETSLKPSGGTWTSLIRLSWLASLGTTTTISFQNVSVSTSCETLAVLQQSACSSLKGEQLYGLEVVPGRVTVESWQEEGVTARNVVFTCNNPPSLPNSNSSSVLAWEIPKAASSCAVGHVQGWQQLLEQSEQLQLWADNVTIVLDSNITVAAESVDPGVNIQVYRRLVVTGVPSRQRLVYMSLGFLHGEGLWEINHNTHGSLVFEGITFPRLPLGPADKFPMSVFPWGMWNVRMERCELQSPPALILKDCTLVTNAETMDYASHWAGEYLSVFPDRKQAATWYGEDPTCPSVVDHTQNRSLLNQQIELLDQYTWVAQNATVLGLQLLHTTLTSQLPSPLRSNSSQGLQLTKLFDQQPYVPFPAITWVTTADAFVRALQQQPTQYIAVLANISIDPTLWGPEPIKLHRDLVIAGWPSKRTVIDWRGVTRVMLLEQHIVKMRNMVLMNGGQGGPDAQPAWAANLTLYQWPLMYEWVESSLQLQCVTIVVPPSEFTILKSHSMPGAAATGGEPLSSGNTLSTTYHPNHLTKLAWVQTAVFSEQQCRVQMLVEMGMVGTDVILTSKPVAFPLLPKEVVLTGSAAGAASRAPSPPSSNQAPDGTGGGSWRLVLAIVLPLAVCTTAVMACIAWAMRQREQRRRRKDAMALEDKPQHMLGPGVPVLAHGGCPHGSDNGDGDNLQAPPDMQVACLVGTCHSITIHPQGISGHVSGPPSSSVHSSHYSAASPLRPQPQHLPASHSPTHAAGQAHPTSHSGVASSSAPAGPHSHVTSEHHSRSHSHHSRSMSGRPGSSNQLHVQVRQFSGRPVGGLNGSVTTVTTPLAGSVTPVTLEATNHWQGNGTTPGSGPRVGSGYTWQHPHMQAGAGVALTNGDDAGSHSFSMAYDSFDAPSDPRALLINRLQQSSDQGKESVVAGGVAVSGEADVASQLKGLVSRMQEELGDQEVHITRVLGQGGGGVVYQGVWRGLTVAVKSLVFTVLPDQPISRHQQRAMTEAAICRTLHHPNIVATYSYDLQALQSVRPAGVRSQDQLLMHHLQGPYTHTSGPNSAAAASLGCPLDGPVPSVHEYKLQIIQEYCDGGTLRGLIDEGKLLQAHSQDAGPHAAQQAAEPEPFMAAILQLAVDVATGMAHVHSRNIVHGDLTPANVLLRTDSSTVSHFTAKVSDFGLSWKLARGQEHVSNARQGTTCYISPEVLHVGIMSRAADVWSFGMILHEMFHGTPSWRKRRQRAQPPHTDAAVVAGAMSWPGLEQLHWSCSCPPQLRTLITSCLSPDPAMRPTFSSVCNKLQAMQATLCGGSVQGNSTNSCPHLSRSCHPAAGRDASAHAHGNKEQHPHSVEWSLLLVETSDSAISAGGRKAVPQPLPQQQQPVANHQQTAMSAQRDAAPAVTAATDAADGANGNRVAAQLGRRSEQPMEETSAESASHSQDSQDTLTDPVQRMPSCFSLVQASEKLASPPWTPKGPMGTANCTNHHRISAQAAPEDSPTARPRSNSGCGSGASMVTETTDAALRDGDAGTAASSQQSSRQSSPPAVYASLPQLCGSPHHHQRQQVQEEAGLAAMAPGSLPLLDEESTDGAQWFHAALAGSKRNPKGCHEEDAALIYPTSAPMPSSAGHDGSDGHATVTSNGRDSVSGRSQA